MRVEDSMICGMRDGTLAWEGSNSTADGSEDADGGCAKDAEAICAKTTTHSPTLLLNELRLGGSTVAGCDFDLGHQQ